MTRVLDCGDNSCHFAKDKSGMRTNGGCRCFEQAGFRSRSAIASAYEMLPKYLDLIDRVKELEDEIQHYVEKEAGASI